MLPLGLFPTAHSSLVQHASSAALGLDPYAIRPQLAPLVATRDTARRIGERLRRAVLWRLPAPNATTTSSSTSITSTFNAAASSPSTSLLLALRLSPSPPPTYQRILDSTLALSGGLAALAAHAGALSIQLRATRYAARVASALGRRLVIPPLLCFCDRDPSSGIDIPGLLSNGCMLPSAEAEKYLPFTCPPEDVLSDAALDALVDHPAPTSPARTGAYPFSSSSSPSEHEVRLGAGEGEEEEEEGAARVLAARVSAELPSASPPPRLVTLQMDRYRDALFRRTASAVVHAEKQGGKEDRREGREAEAREAEAHSLEAALARGPEGGWCASCAHVAIPPSLLRIGEVTRGPLPCRFCLNFTLLLRGPF